MKTKYNDNLSETLYEILDNELQLVISGKLDNDHNDKDNLLEAILLNNGCKQDKDNPTKMIIYKIIPNQVNLVCMYNWLGNDVNMFFDVVDSQGLIYMVIFMDYFKDILTTREISDDVNEIDRLAILNIGNSEYYDALKKIAEIYLLITMHPSYNMQALATTAARGLIRYNPMIIAIKLLDNICPITQEDIPDVQIDQAREYLNMNNSLLFNGIRVLE